MYHQIPDLNRNLFFKKENCLDLWIAPQNSSAPWPKNIKVENLTFFMTLWNILGWSVSILVGLFYLENLSRAQLGKQLPWRAARWPGGAAIGSALAPSGGGEAQRKISSNHMGTEFLWLRDKCLTSESWQEMMAINCFNARYITNVYSVYNVIKNQQKI